MAEYRTSIDIAASPDRVFDHLVTVEGITAWMGRSATLAPEPGGEFSVDIGGHPARGRYLVVDRPARVAVTWGWEGDADPPARRRARPGSGTHRRGIASAIGSA